jgi:hypothetical protein
VVDLTYEVVVVTVQVTVRRLRPASICAPSVMVTPAELEVVTRVLMSCSSVAEGWLNSGSGF